MAKAQKSPAAASPASATAIADLPRPAYQPAPLAELDAKDAFDNLREQCRNSSYSLLDKRDGRWSLMVFGTGQTVRTFTSLNEGIEFVRDLKLPNVRCLEIPEGAIQ